MSICINDDLIWVAVPRCASMSMENAIMTTPNLKYTHILDVDETMHDMKFRHVHVSLGKLRDFFGDKETIRIVRPWMDHWMSGFRYIWQSIHIHGLTPIIEYPDVDNEFVYSMFTREFVDDLLIIGDDNYNVLSRLYSRFVKEDVNSVQKMTVASTGIRTLCPQNYWVLNERCTYEFDINDLEGLERFMSDRYDVDFKLKIINTSDKERSKIVIDDKFKNFIIENFEKPFIRTKNLI